MCTVNVRSLFTAVIVPLYQLSLSEKYTVTGAPSFACAIFSLATCLSSRAIQSILYYIQTPQRRLEYVDGEA